MKRPGTGILGDRLKDIIGKKVKRNLLKDYQIKFNDLKK